MKQHRSAGGWPDRKIQLAYVQAPFHASEDNGQG